MKLITPQTQANEAAEHFYRMYHINGWITCHPKDWVHGPEPIYRQLLALGPTPSPDAVNAITNSSWISVPSCTECNEPQTAVIEFDSDNYGTTTLCRGCLTEALSEITK